MTTRAAVSRGNPPAYDTEGKFQSAVIQIAYGNGWGMSSNADKKLDAELAGYGQPPATLDGLTFHPRVMIGSEPGWPDLTIIRRRDHRLVFAELKLDTKTSKVSDRQSKVLELLWQFRSPDPLRTMRDGSRCWCVSDDAPHDGWIHSPVCEVRRDSPFIEVFVWRPSNMADIHAVLA